MSLRQFPFPLEDDGGGLFTRVRGDTWPREWLLAIRIKLVKPDRSAGGHRLVEPWNPINTASRRQVSV